MADQERWRGKSGESYTYEIHKLPWRPSPNQDGNYIFAKKPGQFWHAVYVGQGNLQDRYDAALDDGCVTVKGATHYHVHLNSNSNSRTREESDIIAGNPECMDPTGCNRKG